MPLQGLCGDAGVHEMGLAHGEEGNAGGGKREEGCDCEDDQEDAEFFAIGLHLGIFTLGSRGFNESRGGSGQSQGRKDQEAGRTHLSLRRNGE
jgi:hypothetical protein